MSDNIRVVAIAIFNQTDGKYLICRRGPMESGAGAWEFPGGKIDAGETDKQALAREIQEELNVQIDVAKLIFISGHNHQYADKNIQISLYKYNVLDLDFTLVDHDQAQWVGLSEMHDYSFSEADLPFIKNLKLI
jgi:8-oxo-dGTP diphosphatase